MEFLIPRSACRLPISNTAFVSRTAHNRCQRGIASAAAVQGLHRIQDLPPLSVNDIPPPPHIAQVSQRKERIQAAKSFSGFLTDNFSRQHDYLRISITERCNLRCTYCMPEEGVPLSPPSHLLTTPEISYLSSLFVSQGVTKIRLTGGEPTIRRDILTLMHSIGALRSKGLRELCLTTNGIALHRKLDSMVEAGLTGVNLSLDTLDPYQFQIMTRRMGFEAVMKSLDRILEMNKHGARIKLKVNCVVMRGINEREIIPFVEMGREKDVEVRFIEYMPFDGNKWSKGKMLSYKEMLGMIREEYPTLRKVQDHENDTSKTFKVPGFAGKIGFITSMTHNFCGTCNRLRITSDGNLKVCLFGNAEVSLRDLLRKGNGGEPIDEEAMEALKKVEMDRRQNSPGSMGVLGYGERERELLEVIGMAVKRKKEKHAGMGELENMKNRPMILIDNSPVHYLQSRKTTTARPTLGLFAQAGIPSTSIAQSRPNIPVPIPFHLLAAHPALRYSRPFSASSNLYQNSTPSNPSSSPPPSSEQKPTKPPPTYLPHLTPSSTLRITSITPKATTHRLALAVGRIRFSTPGLPALIRSYQMKKGDVLAVARVAGVMAVKSTAAIVPLCHSGVPVEGVRVDVEVVDAAPTHADSSTSGSSSSSPSSAALPDETKPADSRTKAFDQHGGIHISVRVETTAKTGIEMEALAGVAGAGLSVIDMVKAVDKHCVLEGVKVVGKRGGRSGDWGVLKRQDGGVGVVGPELGQKVGQVLKGEGGKAEGADDQGTASEKQVDS